MQKILTEDGSESFFNEDFQESYHSKAGAVSEAKQKYASVIVENANYSDNLIIFDMFFGLGYNSAAAIDALREKNFDSLIEIHCFENDINILRKILEVNPGFESYGLIKEFVRGFVEEDRRQFSRDNVYFLMYFGDAEKMIRDIQDKADFVLFDPFSPKKHPGAWIFPFFKDIYEKMLENGVFITYSCATKVRKDLEAVGFIVKDGPVFGRKSPGTIAFRKD